MFEDIPDTEALIAAGRVRSHGTVTRLHVTRRHLQCVVFRSEAATARVVELDLSSAPGTQQYCCVSDFLQRLYDGVERGLECCGATCKVAAALARCVCRQ